MAVAVRPCIVSFLDADGIRHSVEVQAESLYEAAVLGMSSFRQHDCPLGPASQLEIKVTSPSVTHMVTVKKVGDWLGGGARSPKEKLVKQRLKAMLSA